MIGAPPGPAMSKACSGDVGGAWTKCDALTPNGGSASVSSIGLSARGQQHKQRVYVTTCRDHILSKCTPYLPPPTKLRR